MITKFARKEDFYNGTNPVVIKENGKNDCPDSNGDCILDKGNADQTVLDGQITINVNTLNIIAQIVFSPVSQRGLINSPFMLYSHITPNQELITSHCR